MKPERGLSFLLCLLALLLVTGCGPAASPSPPSATVSEAGVTRIPPTATLPPAAMARPTVADPETAEPPVSPLPTPQPAADPTADGALTSPLATPVSAGEGPQLVVLHSNDNWGETQPCG